MHKTNDQQGQRNLERRRWLSLFKIRGSLSQYSSPHSLGWCPGWIRTSLVLIVWAIGLSHPAAWAAEDFVVLGEEGIWVREGSRVVSGDVGANVASAGPYLASDQEVTIGLNVIVQDPTSRVMGDTMRLKSGSQVYDVFVNTLKGPGLIQGTLTTPVSLPVVPALPPVPPVTPGTQDFDVTSGGTLTLDAGSYGLLKAQTGAVVTLTGGLYHFREWNIRAQAQVLATAPVEIRVLEHLETRDHVVVGPAPTAPTLTAADVVIIGVGINGTTGAIDATPEAVKFGTDNTIRANIYAPNGLLRIKTDSVATGAFVGKWVRMGNGGTITLEGGFGLGTGGSNEAPVANAGPDQAVQVNDLVQLDGSGSTDADGDALNFIWTLESQPATSTATLADATSVLPTLPIDEPGDYVVQLIVNDGTDDSDPDTVTLSTGNLAPVAQAGPDQTIAVSQPAFLDGTGSTDANGDGLTYQWTLTSQPASSTATLDDPASATPSFTVDQAGTYTVTLLVSDGLLTSEADLVIIVTDNSAPVANAGLDHNVRPGTTVTLDGTGSSDVDGNPLTYQWSQTVVPPGNTASISDPTAAAPTLTPDVAGEYVAQLQVNDGTATSEPDTALIRVGNSAPIAEAGPDQAVAPNTTVQLDGTNSSDPQSDPLTFQWTLAPPTGSTATLSDATIAEPTFTTDVEGTYVVTLIVNDGDLDSDSDTVTVIVTPAAQLPSITGFSPSTGPMGTVITITGEHFDPVLANNQVQLNGNDLVLSGGSETSLTITVSSGSTTGLLTVITPEGSTDSVTAFTITSRTDFTLQAVPPVASAMQGGAASYAITLTTDGDFTNLVSLSLADVPADVSVRLSSPAISANQTVFLTLSPSTATPAGVVPVSLVGTTTLDTGTKTDTLPLSLIVIAGGGQTHVSGQFLTADTETPIPNVIVNIGANQVTSDAAGRFLLQNIPAGMQKLMISGDTPVGAYAYSIDYTFVAGQAHVLPPFYLTPDPPLAQFTPINNSTAPQVITDARYPGYSMTLPAGVSIIGWDGLVKTGIAIEEIALDRLGVPMPPRTGGGVYKAFFTNTNGVSAMGGSLSPPGSIIPFSMPNDLNLAPGDKAEMWMYDASPVDLSAPSGWKLAGLGTVSADGLAIVADPGVGFTRFCKHCSLAQCSCLGDGSTCKNTNPESDKDGDPVDLATGTFTANQRDLVLPGLLPVSIERVFNANDAFGVNGSFRDSLVLSIGRGWILSYDVALTKVGSVFRMVLPGNRRVDFSPQPNNTWTNATHVFLQGAVLTELSNSDRALRYKDGRTWTFRLAHTFSDGSKIDLLIQQDDRNGNTTTIERNGTQITRIVDASGRELNFLYSDSRLSQVRDPLGRTVTYQYDNNRRLSTVTNPEGGTTEYTYDTQHNLLTIKDARGIKYITNYHGASNRVLRQVMADGGEWRYRYHLQGATVTGPGCPGLSCPMVETWETVQAGYSFTGGTICATTVVDPVGVTRTTRFNTRGYTIDRIDGLGQKVVLKRGASNLVTSRVNPLGHAINFGYDARGNVTTIRDPLLQETQLEYEPNFSGVSKVTNALGHVQGFSYDSRGNVTQVTNPVMASSFVTYSALGQILHIQLPDLSEPPTSFAYDSVGNLTTITNPLGQTVQRSFDVVSRVTAFSDPRGFTTRLTYDGLNRVRQLTNAVGGISTFGYDGNANLTTRMTANTQVFTHGYDTMDRRTSTVDSLNRPFSFQYDQIGNITQLTDRKNQPTTYSYDILNRPTSITYGDGNTVTFEYDSVGRLQRITDSSAGTIDWVYDTLGRVIQEITPQGSVSYQYDAIGRRTQMVVNGQAPVTYQYDDADRLTRVVQGSLFAAMTYDVNDRRTSLVYSNGTTTTYTYDHASQVTAITHTGPSGLIDQVSYTYDAAGNQTGVTRTNGAGTVLPAAISAASYDAANQQTTFNGATLTYDAKGFLESDGTNTYQWDARDRLIGISGGVTAAFTYDALGRRMTKTVNGQTTQFIYDGSDIVAEIDSQEGLVTYLRGLTRDEPFIRQTSSGQEYYHLDVLGSPLVLSNGLGALTTSYSYDPFGQTTVTGASSNAFQFTGRENDGTGLYYYRARYYSPTFHRFISEDPIGLAGGDPNFYGYVGNNPINARDPSGLLNPLDHFYVTYNAARDNGMNVGSSFDLARDVVLVDSRTDTFNPDMAIQNQHGTGGLENGQPQSTPDARAGITEALNNSLQNGNLAGAIHNGQDIATPLHLDNTFKGVDANFETLHHIAGDWFPSSSTMDRAAANTQAILDAFRSGARLEIGPDGTLRPLGRRKP